MTTSNQQDRACATSLGQSGTFQRRAVTQVGVGGYVTPVPATHEGRDFGGLEYVRKVLTRVAAVVGGGTRRVMKEPGGCLHLVINP